MYCDLGAGWDSSIEWPLCAKMDHAPVFAITKLQHSDLISTFTQQDVALDKLFVDASVCHERIMTEATWEAWPI
jgi:pyruvate dehydrogenase (quinone)/pyruvate oxidase